MKLMTLEVGSFGCDSEVLPFFGRWVGVSRLAVSQRMRLGAFHPRLGFIVVSPKKSIGGETRKVTVIVVMRIILRDLGKVGAISQVSHGFFPRTPWGQSGLKTLFFFFWRGVAIFTP